MSVHQNFLALVLCFFSTFTCANTEYVQYGRYLTATYAQPHVNPLNVTVQRHFPSNISTIEQALVFLLEGTGYTLAAKQFTVPAVHTLYQQSFPKSQKILNPMKLEQALIQLVGTPYQIIHDPVNRQISFILRTEYQGWTHERA